MPALVHADRFEPLPAGSGAERWRNYPAGDELFATLVGFELVEVRRDYAALTVPVRSELLQPAGVVHGGVHATLLDSVVVPAIGSAYESEVAFSTIELGVRYLGPVTGGELLAEGWVVKRGRSIAFCAAELRNDGELVATATLTYKISPDRTG